MISTKCPFNFIALLILFLSACTSKPKTNGNNGSVVDCNVSLVVLGTAQDAGAPQAGCEKSCCANKWNDKRSTNLVSSLGLIDAKHHKTYLFDATPNFPEQLHILTSQDSLVNANQVDGIFLTHAHIGHYTGLIHLGKEAMDAKSVSTYAMPRMKMFLESRTLESVGVKKEYHNFTT